MAIQGGNKKRGINRYLSFSIVTITQTRVKRKIHIW